MRSGSWFALAAVVVLGGLPPAVLSAQEWTRFRGPNGAGAIEGIDIPGQWTEKDANWKIELPGVGHSSPVLWGDKIFLLSADPKTAERHVLCYNAADGKLNWRRDYPGVPHHLHVRSSFASCTPAADEKQIYVVWSDPEHTMARAFSHDGTEVWSLDLGPWVSQHGYGASPMVYQDLVIVTCSQEPEKRGDMKTPKESFMVAVDKNSGKIRWRLDRGIDTTSYSVPVIRKNEAGGDELVCCTTAEGMFALDPLTGKELWSQKAFTMRTVSTPQLIGGLVFGTTGSGGGGNYVVAIKPGAEPQIAYEIRKEAPYVPTPVAKGELIFLWSDKGIVTCIRAGDGSQVWQKRVGGVGYSGSPVRAGDKVVCVDEAGVVVTIAAGEKFEELGRVDLKEECRSTPALAGGRMYVRTISHLYSVGGKK